MPREQPRSETESVTCSNRADARHVTWKRPSHGDAAKNLNKRSQRKNTSAPNEPQERRRVKTKHYSAGKRRTTGPYRTQCHHFRTWGLYSV